MDPLPHCRLQSPFNCYYRGGKIHATIRKELLYLFQSKIVEGDVYEMSFFSVAPSSGSYRATLHPYKLLFQMKTKVQNCKSSFIPNYGLSFTKIAEICSHTSDYEYLVDVIGLLTGISAEREYIRDGKITKMIVLELTDDSGKIECALFGDYVDTLQKLMAKSVGGIPVVVIQYAKIKTFREKASIQNVMNTTRILVNPDIQEVVDFKNGVLSPLIMSLPLVRGKGLHWKKNFCACTLKKPLQARRIWLRMEYLLCLLL